jgi:hypothetical protein
MSGEHEARASLYIATGDHVSVYVRAHIVGEFRDRLLPDLPSGLLVARWTRRVDELVQKI